MAMKDISESARNLVVETLESKGISDRTCLMACEINPSFLSDWRSGNIKNPAFDKVYRLFKHLNLSMDNMEPVRAPAKAPEDEEELIRIYRMMKREGKSMILAAAYAEKRRLAEEGGRAVEVEDADIG